MDIQVSTRLTEEVEMENQKKTKFFFKIALFVGIIGLILNVIISVVCFEEGEEPFWLEIELWISALLFALGLVIPIALKIVTKKSLNTILNMVNQYEFHDESFTVVSYRGEEKVAEAKHYYSEVTKTRLTKHYVYVHIGIRGAYPIELASLTEEEKTWLLSLKAKK